MLDFLIGNDLLSSIVAFIIIFIPAVLVHEFGHFLAAKSVGITVLEFGIGFPPRVARLFTWRETEFTLNWIPIGGFVRPLGEDLVRPLGDEQIERERQNLIDSRGVGTAEMSVDVATNSAYGSELEVLASRGIYETMAVHEAKPFPRIWFFSAGAIANFIFAFLVFVFVGMLGIPKEVGGRVGFISVPEESVLADIGFQAGDVIETIDGKFFANSDDLFVQLRASIGRPVELEITRTDTEPVEQFTLEITPSDQLVALLTQARDFVLIENVDPDSPAEVAGLQAGDLIGGINGQTLNNVSDPVMRLVDTTTEFAGKTLTLTIFRDGNEQEIDVVPRENPPQGQGRIGIGILPETGTPDRSFVYLDGVQRENVSQPPGAAIQYGFERIGEIFRTIAEFPARLISGSTEPEERRVVSAVGISQLGGAILQDSIEENEPVTIIEFVALISIALGFTNLLPIPALDGGRILFVLVELVRGKPIAPEREGLVHLVGLIFMLSVGVIFIINDLVNPFTNIIP